MGRVPHVSDDRARHDQVTKDLRPAPGRRSAPTDEHEAEQQHQGHRLPERVIGRGVAGGGDDARDLERSLPNGIVPRAGALRAEPNRKRGTCTDENSDVEAELVVPRNVSSVSMQGAVPEDEARPRDGHEHDDDPLRPGPERLDRPCLRREPTCRHRRKRVRRGVVQIHLRFEARDADRREECRT